MVSPVRHPSTLRTKAAPIVGMGTGMRPGLNRANCSSLSSARPGLTALIRTPRSRLRAAERTKPSTPPFATDKPAPIDKDLYELPPEEAKDIPQVPASLEAVINRLEEDHDYLLEGGVFTSDLIETWIDLKRTNEIDPLRLRPHPYEFALYYDV